ncbi:MAG TPA: DUF5916 domain-containing protein [Steroidobacter sp.]|nr:DUF5916 domain-containing protein [Steroidobacter sp.]
MRRSGLSRRPRRLFSFPAALCILTGLYTSGPAFAAITPDGALDEPQWREALRCPDWRRTTPFARDQPRYSNELLLLSLPEGLAAAFVIDQPPVERRIKPRTPRDSEALIGDSVSLMIDFDATGQIGYEFSVGLGGGVRDGLITNQNTFDRDWDGEWSHAVRETDQQWIVELFVPWSTVSMRGSRSDMRTIGVYGSRYLYERNERYACPGISTDSGAFLSDFHRMQIAQHETNGSSLEVTPYATVIRDFLHDDSQLKVGADLVWKASPRMWLTATLNPDFGQVESDELVVDFSAIETVFTDKRPFFTENQGVFDLRTPASGQLIYTRRIGAAPDDLSAGSSDIDAAFKLTGDAGSLVYGAFIAQESEYASDRGRLFAAGRLALPLERARIGYLATYTDRPFLDRDALINALDFETTPSDALRLAAQVIRSDIGTAGMGVRFDSVALTPLRLGEIDTHGYQAWLEADINRSAPVSHALKALYIDRRFDMNDLGYMERNSLEQIEWESNRRVAGEGGSSFNGETQRLYTYWRRNSQGQRLQSRVQLSRDVQYTNAWRAYQEIRYVTSGVDDLISRGNGPVELDSRFGAYFDVVTPRFGDWQFTVGGYLFQQGVEDYSGWLQMVASWYPTEKLTLRLDVTPQLSNDWLLWQGQNLFGSYRAERLDFDFRLDWIPAAGHELRLKWQWIGVEADLRRAYRTDAGGRLIQTTDALAPFNVSNLGVQLRYRYQFAPQSELFLVYARGGYQFIEQDQRDLGGLFGDMGDLRDADQFLVKIRYRL